jgi:4-hydroxy-tetrahydrodipicolinate synthase
MKLEGLYTALITPFDSQGKLDEEGLRHNLRYQIKHKVQGIVVLGTTGEAPTLSHQEKRTVVEISLEEVKGKATLMVGTGSYSTEQTIASTRLAQEMGADAALIVTPYYNKPTQEGLYRHFEAICKAVSIPICIYNIQGRTGQNLQTETLGRLMAFPSIIGIKEASGNILQINEVLEVMRKKRPHFRVVSGDDILTFPLMALGGHGVVSVASNLIPGPILNLVQAALSGDFINARHWHYQLLPVFKAAFIETNPIPIKAAMNLCGMAAGCCRLPLCDLSPTNFQELKQLLNTLPPSWLGEYGQT